MPRPEKERMVSRPMINGTKLYIQGGNIHFRGNVIRCLDCGQLFNTDFQSDTLKCPACSGANLEDLAGNFGHGRCCWRHSQK